MSKNIYAIAGLALGALFVLVALNFMSDSPNRHNNGFQRYFKMNAPIKEVNKVKLKYSNISVQNICGFNDSTFFLSDNIPGNIVVANIKSNIVDTIRLRLPPIKALAPVFYTAINFPNISILAGNAKVIIKGNLQSQKYNITHVKTGPFSNGITLSQETFVMRCIDTSTLQAVFKKVDLNDNRISSEKNISENIRDAGFAYDGYLAYDNKTCKFIYVSFYCNQFVCFDTSLNLLYKAHTIDTSYVPKSEIKNLTKSITQDSPPMFSNKGNCAYNGILYVRSVLKADNEKIKSFNSNDVIDMYNEKNGKYLGSFYIPMPNGERLKKFLVINNNEIVGLYPSYLIKYNLDNRN